MKQEMLFKAVTADFRESYQTAAGLGETALRELLLKLTLYLSHPMFIVNRVALLQQGDYPSLDRRVLDKVLRIIDTCGIRQGWEREDLNLTDLVAVFYDAEALPQVFTAMTGLVAIAAPQATDPWNARVPNLEEAGPATRIVGQAAGSGERTPFKADESEKHDPFWDSPVPNLTFGGAEATIRTKAAGREIRPSDQDQSTDPPPDHEAE